MSTSVSLEHGIDPFQDRVSLKCDIEMVSSG